MTAPTPPVEPVRTSHLFNAREYVSYWFKRKKLDVNERGVFTNESRPSEIFRTLMLDYTEEYNRWARDADRANRNNAIKHDMMKMAFQEQLDVGREIAMAFLREGMKFCGTENFSELTRYVIATTGTEDLNTLTVLKHAIWLVKRNQWNFDVVNHIMPIFYGKTGGGKSTALKMLLSPLKGLVMDTSLHAVLNTEKYGMALSNNWAAILDEMSGAGRIEMEDFKKQTTAKYNDVREYHSQNVIKVRQRVTFFGTSNKPVAEILYDTTGMRRYYEVACQDKMDWETINSINYLAIWQGVDENKPDGYLGERAAEINLEQQKLVGIDDISAFMEAYDLDPSSTDTKFISNKDVYIIFELFCDSSGIHKRDNAVWFSRKLKGKGFKAIAKKVDNKTIRGFMVNASSSVHGTTYVSLDGGGKKNDIAI